jgi:hypothetical protein
MEQIAKDIVAEIQHEIVSEGLVYTRQLFESWEITNDGDEITIGSPLIYAAALDGGRVPGSMPPVSALFPWVQDKIPTKSKEEAMSIAFAIAKKIEAEGIEPTHYVRRALLQLEADTE